MLNVNTLLVDAPVDQFMTFISRALRIKVFQRALAQSLSLSPLYDGIEATLQRCMCMRTLRYLLSLKFVRQESCH